MTRYAVYWAPEETHPLWQAGSSWLGRDASVLTESRPAHEATQEPRRYGFHATLKAPIRLHAERDAPGFIAAVQELAAHIEPFRMPALQVAWLHDFLALQPADAVLAHHPLRRLADVCVQELDPWRAYFDATEFARRAAGLDDEQRRLFERWGYPFVFDRWRFHMTLSCSIPSSDETRRRSVQEAAQSHFDAALREPVHCESLCVFIEAATDAPFVLAHRFPLAKP